MIATTVITFLFFICLMILLASIIFEKITSKVHEIKTNLIAIKLREKEEERLNGKSNTNVRT